MNEKEAVVEEEAKYVENQRMIDDGNDWLLKRTIITVMLYYNGSKNFLYHCPLTLLCISSSPSPQQYKMTRSSNRFITMNQGG